MRGCRTKPEAPALSDFGFPFHQEAGHEAEYLTTNAPLVDVAILPAVVPDASHHAETLHPHVSGSIVQVSAFIQHIVQDSVSERIKRRIDRSNQDRTDMVEYIDSYLLEKYRDVRPAADARLNTETPAWAIDRLSILALKIYHMSVETHRGDVDAAHREACARKLEVLLTQQKDLSRAIEELIEDIEAGRKYMKTYKQMKMYNDPSLNPVLYASKK